MSALTTSVDKLPIAPVENESAAILSVIERMATNPEIDPDRIERFIAMKERIDAQVAERAFNVAMSAAQEAMQPVRANLTNVQTKSKYASYDKLDAAIRPIYTKHGFALSFDEADCPKPEHVRVLCYVTHTAGHTRTYHRDMPADGKGAKGGDVMTKTHAAGAASSYGMRYILKGVFNLAVSDDDKDGNAPAAPVKTITPEQVKRLQGLIEAAGTTADIFCEVGKIAALPDLAAADFDNAFHWLNERIAARKGKAKAAVDPTSQFDQMERGR